MDDFSKKINLGLFSIVLLFIAGYLFIDYNSTQETICETIVSKSETLDDYPYFYVNLPNGSRRVSVVMYESLKKGDNFCYKGIAWKFNNKFIEYFATCFAALLFAFAIFIFGVIIWAFWSN